MGRLGFTPQNMSALTRLRTRFEVAADTIHPEWRELLSVVGEQSSCVYRGQPCDWVMSRSSPPVRLADTCSQWDTHFWFKHLEESVIDEKTWDRMDPRAEKGNTQCTLSRHCSCGRCGSTQSNDPRSNESHCFPVLFGCGRRRPRPVQVFRTENGRNNGLFACTVSLSCCFIELHRCH